MFYAQSKKDSQVVSLFTLSGSARAKASYKQVGMFILRIILYSNQIFENIFKMLNFRDNLNTNVL